MSESAPGVEKQAATACRSGSKRGVSGRLATGGILIKPYGSIASAPVHTVVRRRLKRMENRPKQKPFQIVTKNRKVIVVVAARRTCSYPEALQPCCGARPSTRNSDFFGTVYATSHCPGALPAERFYRAVVNASTR